MLARIYSIIFLFILIISFWYQRVYLEKIENEFHLELNAANSILPVIHLTNFTWDHYNGLEPLTFSTGDELTWYNNEHFEGKGHLTHSEFSNKNYRKFFVQATEAKGHTEGFSFTTDKKTSQGKLIEAFLPGLVSFQFEENTGQGRDFFFDARKNMMSSKNNVFIHGPQGYIEGGGFYYSLDDGELHITQRVKGKILIPDRQSHKGIQP